MSSPKHYLTLAKKYLEKSRSHPNKRLRYLAKAFSYYQLVGGKYHCLPTDPAKYFSLGTTYNLGSPRKCGPTRKGNRCYRNRMGQRKVDRLQHLYEGICSHTDVDDLYKVAKWEEFSKQLSLEEEQLRQDQEERQRQLKRETEEQIEEEKHQRYQDDLKAVGRLTHPRGFSHDKPVYEIQTSGLISFQNGYIYRPIATGGFGYVYLWYCQYQDGVVPTAVKYLVTSSRVRSFYKLSIGTTEEKHVENEIAVLRHLRKVDGVVHLYDSYKLNRPLLHKTPRDQYVTLLPGYYLYMDYCMGGELLDLILKSRFASDLVCRIIIRRVASIMKECHSLNVVHRDLKPENILIDTAGADGDFSLNDSIRVSDFGLGKITQKKRERMSSLVGSRSYLPPEFSNQVIRYTQKCDVWSLGVMMFVLLYGFQPFQKRNNASTTRAIRQQAAGIQVVLFHPSSHHYKGRPPPTVSPSAIALLRRIFTFEDNRPSMSELLEDPWLQLTEEQIDSVKVRMHQGRALSIQQPSSTQTAGSVTRVHRLRQYCAEQGIQKIKQTLSQLYNRQD